MQNRNISQFEYLKSDNVFSTKLRKNVIVRFL